MGDGERGLLCMMEGVEGRCASSGGRDGVKRPRWEKQWEIKHAISASLSTFICS